MTWTPILAPIWGKNGDKWFWEKDDEDNGKSKSMNYLSGSNYCGYSNMPVNSFPIQYQTKVIDTKVVILEKDEQGRPTKVQIIYPPEE